jgi:hypothetical protein
VEFGDPRHKTFWEKAGEAGAPDLKKGVKKYD